MPLLRDCNENNLSFIHHLTALKCILTFLIIENMSIHSNASLNTLGPSFQINLQSLIKTPDIVCEEDDSKQVANVIKRHISALKKVIVK